MAWCRGGCGPPLSARPWCSSPSASWSANRVLDLVEADTANQFVRHLAEATLTLVLFRDAVRVNRGRLRHKSALPTRLLGIGLPLTIVAGTLAGLAFFPQLDRWTAAALATHRRRARADDLTPMG